jgi:hypothetical protein
MSRVFCSLHDFLSFSRSTKPASVATLPSALVVERFSLGASLRATATTARFLAFFPPRAESFFPQHRKSLSSPKGPKM